MKNLLFPLCFILVCHPSLFAQDTSITSFTSSFSSSSGFFNYYWDNDQGKMYVEIDKVGEPFLYVNSLKAGVGSNDIGLDRGQLGNTRIVRFEKVGNKVLLIQPNYGYRAESENENERKSVREAFAESTIWGFKVAVDEGEKILIDITDFLLRDAHGITGRLSSSGQGNYSLATDRSAVYLPATKNFPKNTEFEATVTFTGDPKGTYIRQVVPTPAAVTVRMHHSFIELPDDQYQRRAFDPRAGYIHISYQDYATPIDQPLVKRYIVRHRLEKKDPSADMSEAVAPIVYYVDAGTPEPIRSALIEGASWWNEAFEAAGFKDAFQVKVLPVDADPMDVRYNVIQWVHRATRGWSYGASVRDPRTGEIIKGHVSLGSLRVRQDFLIAQGLLKPFETGKPASKEMQEMALARLRQLSAHEVGHTLGLVHNFAASVNNRASVMDYPHPYITFEEDQANFSEAYDTGIGEWDKYTIRYGYSDFPDQTNEAEALTAIISEYISNGFMFISDQDARPTGGAHPQAHLWDNGTNAVDELERMLDLREKALHQFGEYNIPEGRPLAELEDVLVPLYFGHRYQVEAVAKFIGGNTYTYAVRGDGQVSNKVVEGATQKKALESLLNSLKSEALSIPENLLTLIPPRPLGYYRGREHFKIHTGKGIDPVSAARSAAQHTLQLLFHYERANRIVIQHSLDNSIPSLSEIIRASLNVNSILEENMRYNQLIAFTVQDLTIQHLMQLAKHDMASSQVKAIVRQELKTFQDQLESTANSLDNSVPNIGEAHLRYEKDMIEQFFDDPSSIEAPESLPMPDGSPIGSCSHLSH